MMKLTAHSQGETKEGYGCPIAERGGVMRRLVTIVGALLLLATGAAPAQSARAGPDAPEKFDLSGFPRRPTTFLEQQIRELLDTHQAGDMASAATIQRKLAQFYRDRGDTARVRAAERRALAATPPAGQLASDPPAATPTRGRLSTPRAAPTESRAFASRGATLTGRYYYMDGGTLHTWEFDATGEFRHTSVASGSGTSVRNLERGSYRVDGAMLELRFEQQVSAFATPGAGDRTTQLGASSSDRSVVRRVRYRLIGHGGSDGMVLDGKEMKPKSW